MKKATTMTEAASVTTATEPAAAEPQLSVSQEAKNIADRAKSADAFEYDDKERAEAVFAKLPEGEFAIAYADKTVIQKL